MTYPGSGTEDTLTAIPDTGWEFAGWSGDCSGTAEMCSLTLDPSDTDLEAVATFTPITAPPTDSTLTVTVKGEAADDAGSVTGGQIDCETGSTGCQWSVATGSTITLLASPGSSSIFGGWSGACTSESVSCTVQLSSDRAVTATFRKPKVAVTVSGDGTVTGSGVSCTSAGGAACTASVGTGDQVTLTAAPGAGGSFTGWSGACTGAGTTCTVTADDDKNVTAAFSGAGTGGGAGATFPLSVSVSGNGTVTGGGIRCGSGETTCSANETSGSTVTLTATSSSGASFQSWAGACSGGAPTCTVTMTAARNVTATFSGGTGGGDTTLNLSVTVTGPGAVSGGGIRCGNGGKTCTADETENSEITLTATPAPNATFTGWDGACSGAAATCTVTMDAAKSVSAAFKGQTRTPSGTAGGKVLQSRGRPLVTRTRTGFAVTLRFATAQRGAARVRALRAGRLQAALAFAVTPGPAAVRFPVTKPGLYRFEVALGARRLRWTACLGLCGEAAARLAGPFALVRRAAAVVDSGPLWSVTLRYGSTQPAAFDLRVYRRARLVRAVRTTAPAGAQSTGLLLSPGDYAFRLTATDAYGRVRTLRWVAVLP